MENKISLSSLAASLAQLSGKSRKFCEDFLKEFFKLIRETLEAGESLRIKGFGTFKIVEVDSRSGVNVANGEKQEIASYKKVSFSPAKELAAIINAPFENFESVELDDEMPEEDFLDYQYTEPQTDQTQEAEAEKDSDSELQPETATMTESELEVKGEENEVPQTILETGSDEEYEDDEITYEAYSAPQSQPETEPTQTLPTETVTEYGNDLQSEHGEAQDKEPVVIVSKSRFGIGFLSGALTSFAVCVVIFMLGCFFNWWPVNFEKASDLEKQLATQEMLTDEDNQAEEEVTVDEPEPVYDTVSTTRYLTTISRDHYGDYNFWPYIYMENASILGHPDRITPGTKVVVPDLSKYGVNPKDKEQVAIAKKKAAEIYARYK